MQMLLRRERIAHCDIKAENLVLTYSKETGVKLCLIDVDQAVSFGQIREVGTQYLNVLPWEDWDLGKPTNEETDDIGFLLVKNFIFVGAYSEI